MPIPQEIPPKLDEIEVSIFGPGFGESIVAHVGNGDWIIIDSCIEEMGRVSKPIEYLKTLGVDPAQSVRIVVATHWHDDHVAGLSGALEACQTAVFCCPDALSNKDFLRLAELYKEAPAGFPTGPEEIIRAIEISSLRSKTFGKQMLKWAKADNLIWASSQARMIALSPSDEMIRRAIEFMIREYNRAVSGNKLLDRLTPQMPNDTATVVRLDVGERSILLGSDLETERDPLVGWRAVLDTVSATERRSSVYKVAHHGSKSGCYPDVWSKLLLPNPLALLAPFRWGRHKLPNLTDRARILGMTDRAFISAHPDRDAPPGGRRSPKVESFIKQTAKNRRRACGPVGQVRWRATIHDLADEGTVDLFDGALHLKDAA